jgi:anti-sigma B factor antagonist
MQFSIDNVSGRLVGIVKPEGRLDSRNSKSLQKIFPEWLEKTPFVVFDCSLLEFIDSSGLGAIVGCLRKALDKKGEVKLAALNEKVAMVFKLTQAIKLFSVFTNTREALASFGETTD